MSKKLIGGALGSGLFGIGGKVAKSLIAPSKKTTAEPTPTEPVMPMTDDERVKAARKRATVAQMQRQGRASTILSANYSSTGSLGG